MLDLLTLELAISGPSKPTADTPEGGEVKYETTEVPE